MRKTISLCAVLIAVGVSAALAHAQSQPQSQSGQAPVIQINVTRTIQAVNYMAKGSTRIDFRGTALSAASYRPGKSRSQERRGLDQREFR